MSYNRRNFLLLMGSGLSMAALGITAGRASAAEGPFELPSLPYDYDALEPYISAETMVLHHDKHHAGYVRNLNRAVANYPELQEKTVEELIAQLDSLPGEIRTAVRNNGGGHLNHTMFWQIMAAPGTSQPQGPVVDAIADTFGDLETFQEQFNSAGGGRFGSGWVWLVKTAAGDLEITTTPNQDSPLSEGNYPILGNDVWEHAYYLTYRNRRGDYLQDWWNVVNWDEVNRRYAQRLT